MSMQGGQANYEHGTISTTGILIANLGSPDAPTPAAVRRYLKEFLWDPRVVEIPRPIWWLILHGLVLTLRPRKSAHAYQQVWMPEGAPLIVHSQQQAQALQQKLQEQLKTPISLALGMRYGNPSIRAALEQLRRNNVERILVFPLYPQYSAATTASVFDAVAAVFKTWRWVPELRTIGDYCDDAGYISALVNSIREYWDRHGRAQRLMFSFHGMPKRTLLAGDPYHCQCQKTARLVAEQLQLKPEDWLVAFQSRFGREEWLKPYAQETLANLPQQGVKTIDVVCPGFSADCLETLEEMAMRNKEEFIKAGGSEYRYISALNDRADHIASLSNIVLRNLSGWPEPADILGNTALQQQAAASRQRALALGASR